VVSAGTLRLSRRNLVALAGGATLTRGGALAQMPGGSAADTAGRDTGGVRWITLANGYRVWTRRVGYGPCKVLLLHGGPGLSHDYLSCFADFLPGAGYEVYFYDQLGCGRSDRPSDDRLWTLPRFLGEVEEVRAALGLDRFILFGHSWGAILGIEYALRYGSPLRALVLSNMSASFGDYAAYVRHLRDGLPSGVGSRMSALEAAGKIGGSEYQGLITRYLYSRYICRLHPWPADVRRALAGLNEDIYLTMQGPSEFTPTGNLKDWDRWNDLPRIAAPTLVMGARYDEMNPDSLRREADLIPGAELFISRNGSHLAMWDDRMAYFSTLLGFLAKHRAVP